MGHTITSLDQLTFQLREEHAKVEKVLHELAQEVRGWRALGVRLVEAGQGEEEVRAVEALKHYSQIKRRNT